AVRSLRTSEWMITVRKAQRPATADLIECLRGLCQQEGLAIAGAGDKSADLKPGDRGGKCAQPGEALEVSLWLGHRIRVHGGALAGSQVGGRLTWTESTIASWPVRSPGPCCLRRQVHLPIASTHTSARTA